MLMLSYIYNVFHSIFIHAMDKLFMSEIKKNSFIPTGFLQTVTNVKCPVSNSKFFQFLSKIVFHWNKNDFKNRFLQIDNKYKESDSTVCSIWIYYDKRLISTSKWNTHAHTHTYTHIHTHTHTQTHIHTHIHIHRNTQTYTHIHIHTQTNKQTNKLTNKTS